mmetsp:Transcript_17228/g.42409  ORF Transcript_17228/g.42409 Transcript_17228/m.42409 type:complete len:240 (-) Transcript_17228:187-906(-)
MAAAAVDATSAPASPSDATASGARYPLIVTGGILPCSAAVARRRSARHRRCACKCAMLQKKSCSRSLGSARETAPGAAEGHESARRRKMLSASPRVVDSGDLSSPRTPGASTPITAPPRLASAALAAAAARAAAVLIPTMGLASSISSSSSSSAAAAPSSEATTPSLLFFPFFPAAAASDSAMAASRKRSSAEAAAWRRAMSEPLSSCRVWWRMGAAAAEGDARNQSLSRRSYAPRRRS